MDGMPPQSMARIYPGPTQPRDESSPFPIDIAQTEQVDREFSSYGQQTLEYVEAGFPLLRNQQALLKILTEERRERHRILKDAKKQPQTFAPGDLVLVRKQKPLTDAEGVSTKLTFKTKGPYRVLEQGDHEGTYYIQRLPFGPNMGRVGKRLKESAARMEQIPSTLVLHKTTDGIDTRAAQIESEFVTNPLEKYIGAHKFGTYQKAGEEKSVV